MEAQGSGFRRLMVLAFCVGGASGLAVHSFPSPPSRASLLDLPGRTVVTSSRGKAMNWIRRKVYLYNVTFGLYMLDWWERYLFNILVIVLMWFILYNTSRFVTLFWQSLHGETHMSPQLQGHKWGWLFD
ncbi:hypothetical protein MLD38_011099 [Melastoma candidum]|uniref:Uncharacterized protein n=1 Tax=Melastoma candidum TaxID=119954 RepID=A0ACB9R645_9MYRT|nr:hypothetical protein MLD38_011099 [Melastoma candidum]